MDERYEIKISGDHAGVRLMDADTGEIHTFTGRRALFDALGVLAEWRDRDLAQGVDASDNPDYGVSPGLGSMESNGGVEVCYCDGAGRHIKGENCVSSNPGRGPACTCVQASDTGHDTGCPRAAFARGA